MKRFAAFILILVILLPGLVKATPGDIDKKIVTSLSHLTGITWDGQHYWVADRKTYKFYEVDPVTGAISNSIVSPGYFPSGLAWDGKLIWNTDPGNKKIYATNPENGETVLTLDSPTPSPTGIAWDGKFIWICDNRSDNISKLSPEDGTTIISFPSPARDPRGLEYHDGYLWCSDRVRNKIYMICPENGFVIITLDSPGPFSWGLAFRNGKLANTDYQDDCIYEIVVKDNNIFKTSNPRRATVTFTTEAVAMGKGKVKSLDIFYAIPSARDNQKLLSEIQYTPAPKEFLNDRWDQMIAHFHTEDIDPPQSYEATLKAEIETSAIRYFIYPDKVKSEIPREIKKRYLVDEDKYDIYNPYIQKIVKQVVGDETNIYWKARKLYQYLIANMEYKLSGGWNIAPTVLKRKNGSCSEYTFCYTALCRAAGIPARYVGSLVVRGDDASYDDVFHRWNEIYLPGYGWVPVDASGGDSALPADQGSSFGSLSNRFLITTEGGGNSEYLGWSYNHEYKWKTTQKCQIKFFSVAEWEPLKE
jgi:transglutaminase-like putative cysteine protease